MGSAAEPPAGAGPAVDGLSGVPPEPFSCTLPVGAWALPPGAAEPDAALFPAAAFSAAAALPAAARSAAACASAAAWASAAAFAAAAWASAAALAGSFSVPSRK